jgi:transposase
MYLGGKGKSLLSRATNLRRELPPELFSTRIFTEIFPLEYHLTMKSKGRRDDYFPETKNRETTCDERLEVITLRKHTGKSWTQIATITKLNKSTCRQIWTRYLEIGTPSNRPRLGRPLIFTEALKQQLVTFITSNKRTRRLSWEEIREEMGLQCSYRLIKDIMNTMGYHKRMPRKK